MHANEYYLHKSPEFWAYVRLISERLGYSKNNEVLSYERSDVLRKLSSLGISVEDEILTELLAYSQYRKDCLNKFVRSHLMTLEQARSTFYYFKEYHYKNGLTCSLPLNKQKNEKRDYAYFTGIINILTETTLRKLASEHGLIYGKNRDLFFNDNPLNLSYIYNRQGLSSTLSRRFDGAIPDIANPKAIWEIKEYYYTTTFGSRIADGVYETQLDGLEIQELMERTGYNLIHIYFIDDYNTWWNMGKSYLCRIIDMLNSGMVDEVIFGSEVLERWPILLREIIL